LFYKSYIEMTILHGWLDAVDVALAGDFRGANRDQVTFVNRTPAGLDRVMVGDFSGAGMSQAFYQSQVNVSGILQRISANDSILAGDMRGVGHTQLVTLEELEQ
jgi:hypothetical protein